MTVLSYQSIQTLCKGIDPLISPCEERGVIRGRSYGLSSCGYDIRIAENHILLGGSFELGSSFEKFCMPSFLVGIVHDKSSWARQGLAVQNTVLEPGWKGHLTIELSNHSSKLVIIDAGDPICQIIFHRLDAATYKPYVGKYQDQEAGPQPARYEQ